MDFNADTADAPMRYALEGTGWSVGTVNVTTLRTWQCTEKNALSILRATQNIHGGDLIFDCPNRSSIFLPLAGMTAALCLHIAKISKVLSGWWIPAAW